MLLGKPTAQGAQVNVGWSVDPERTQVLTQVRQVAQIRAHRVWGEGSLQRQVSAVLADGGTETVVSDKVRTCAALASHRASIAVAAAVDRKARSPRAGSIVGQNDGM
jgi:hypothetical protein